MPSSITLTVSHLPTSTSFFLSALQPLNYVFRARQDQIVGFGPDVPTTAPADFWITQELPGVPAGAAHVAFPASSRGQVHDFFVVALKAGGKIHGEPAQRDGSGYYSAAVIDFDGNSIEAVYRPGQDEDVKSRTGGASSVVKAPSTVIAPSKTRSVVSKPFPTVVSRAESNASGKAPSKVSSAVRSVTVPVPTSAASHVSGSRSASVPVTENLQSQQPQGDVLNNLMSEARNAVNVAHHLVNSVGGNRAPDAPTVNGTSAGTATTNTGTGTGTSDAIVGTILGVAAGAALHYAFSKTKETQTPAQDSQDDQNRPSVAAALTHPEYQYTYSTVGARTYYEGPDGRVYQTIEPGPAPALSAYTYAPSEGPRSQPRLIGLQDNDPSPTQSQQQLALPAPRSTTSGGSGVSSAKIRPPSAIRRTSFDSGFGIGTGTDPREDVASQAHSQSHASSSSRLSSRHSKKTTASRQDTPPTSYRAPTVLTTAETQAGKSGHSLSSSKSRARSRTRSGSVSRIMSRITGGGVEADEKSVRGESRTRSRSHSRAPMAGSHASRRSCRDEFDGGNSHASRRSRRDEFDDDRYDEAKTVFHVTEQQQVRRTMSHHYGSQEHIVTVGGGGGGNSGSTAGSKVSFSRTSRHPHEYPLPPSRAATWAGSEGGGGSGSFVSAISKPGRGVGGVAPAPRTIIDKLTPVRLRNHGAAGAVADRDFAEKRDSASVVSKQKDVEQLDVTDREVGPEDSVSQISVGSRASGSRKTGSRAGSRR